MVDAPTPPAVPDPNVVAQAQTGSNVQTAAANSALQNANVYTPLGSSVFNVTGSQTISNPDGTSYNVPTYTNTQTLSPEQQQLYNQQTQLGSSTNALAQSQIDKLQGVLGSPMDTSNVAPLTQSVGSGPQLQTSIANAGQIQTRAGLNTNAQTNLGLNTNAPTTFGQTANTIQGSVGDPNSSQAVQNTVNAVMSRTQPQLDRNTDALQAQLATQGITPGSQAYNTAMGLNSQAMNDAYMQADLTGNTEQNTLYNQALSQGQFANSAQQQDYTQQQGRGVFNQQGVAQNNAALGQQGAFNNSAIAQNNDATLNNANFANSAQNQQYTQNANNAQFGNTAQQSMFNNAVTGAQYGNTASQQQLSMDTAERNQPINEITALMSGGQVTMPQFAGYNSGQVASTPVGQYAYNSAGLLNSQYNTQAQQAAATNAGIMNLAGNVAGGAMKLSERMFKRNLKRIGETFGGIPVYSFNYLWSDEPEIGVMVDEVEKIQPSAVRKIFALKHVDYNQIGLAA